MFIIARLQVEINKFNKADKNNIPFQTLTTELRMGQNVHIHKFKIFKKVFACFYFRML